MGYGIGTVWNEDNDDKQEGIINTYDGKNSPGKPEPTDKKKHTTGKCKIIKQYWEEETDEDGKTDLVNRAEEDIKDYYREKAVKNIKITDEEKLPKGKPEGAEF